MTPPVTVTGLAVGNNAPPSSLIPNSVFNSNVQSWPVDPASSQFAADVVADYEAAYGGVGVNSAPIYSVGPDQADVTVSPKPGCLNFTSGTGTEVPIPPYTSLNESADDPLIVYQPSSGNAWEFWEATRNPDGTYSACWGGELDMASTDGVFATPYGLSASGISYLATTITENDIASGWIGHAIAVTLPHCNGSVYPADRTDCGGGSGQPGEGQWFRFPANLAMPSGLTPFGQMVFKAIQTYGMVVTDQGGAVMLEAEQPSDWAAEGHSGTDPITASWAGEQEYQVVASLPWASLQTVDPPR